MRRIPAVVVMAAASVVVTGCVTVSSGPSMKFPPPTIVPTAAPPVPEPRQSDARRALTTIVPDGPAISGPAEAAAAATATAGPGAVAATATAGPGTPSARGTADSGRSTGPGARQDTGHPRGGHPGPRPADPAGPGRRAVPHRDLCALGQRYGRWAPDDEAARICRQAYGR